MKSEALLVLAWQWSISMHLLQLSLFVHLLVAELNLS